MGGGLAYHGGEYRLSFHNTHNDIQLMNDKDAERWVKHMVHTLNDPSIDFTADPGFRPAVNTVLGHFLGKYAEQFKFSNSHKFGDANPAVTRKINFLNMSSDAIEALPEVDLKDALAAGGIDV